MSRLYYSRLSKGQQDFVARLYAHDHGDFTRALPCPHPTMLAALRRKGWVYPYEMKLTPAGNDEYHAANLSPGRRPRTTEFMRKMERLQAAAIAAKSRLGGRK